MDLTLHSFLTHRRNDALLSRQRPSIQPFGAYSSERIPEFEEAKKNVGIVSLL